MTDEQRRPAFSEMKPSPLTEEQRKRVRDLMTSKGACQAATLLRLNRQTLDRCIGGLDLSPWTLLKLGEIFEERDAAGKQP
jgi:hypothetical protein